MIAGLRFREPVDRPLRVLALGAHPDDIEMGAAGLVQRLVAETDALSMRWLVATATEERRREAEDAVSRLVPPASGATCVVDFGDFRDGFLPYLGPAPKEWLAGHSTFDPDIVLCPRRADRHQDHRHLADLVWQVFRNSLVLEYEIPKYEGDLGNPNVFVILDQATADLKVSTIVEAFRSQHGRTWFDPAVFWAMLRLRGLEAASPTGLAEAFHGSKLVL